MMRDAEKTVGNIIDKMKLALISYMDLEGFHIMKILIPQLCWGE
jgi:hypothetical protein